MVNKAIQHTGLTAGTTTINASSSLAQKADDSNKKTSIKEMFFYTKWIKFYKSFDVHFATDRPRPKSYWGHIRGSCCETMLRSNARPSTLAQYFLIPLDDNGPKSEKSFLMPGRGEVCRKKTKLICVHGCYHFCQIISPVITSLGRAACLFSRFMAFSKATGNGKMIAHSIMGKISR